MKSFFYSLIANNKHLWQFQNLMQRKYSEMVHYAPSNPVQSPPPSFIYNDPNTKATHLPIEPKRYSAQRFAINQANPVKDQIPPNEYHRFTSLRSDSPINQGIRHTNLPQPPKNIQLQSEVTEDKPSSATFHNRSPKYKEFNANLYVNKSQIFMPQPSQAYEPRQHIRIPENKNNQLKSFLSQGHSPRQNRSTHLETLLNKNKQEKSISTHHLSPPHIYNHHNNHNLNPNQNVKRQHEKGQKSIVYHSLFLNAENQQQNTMTSMKSPVINPQQSQNQAQRLTLFTVAQTREPALNTNKPIRKNSENYGKNLIKNELIPGNIERKADLKYEAPSMFLKKKLTYFEVEDKNRDKSQNNFNKKMVKNLPTSSSNYGKNFTSSFNGSSKNHSFTNLRKENLSKDGENEKEHEMYLKKKFSQKNNSVSASNISPGKVDHMRNIVNKKNSGIVARKLAEFSPDKIIKERITLEETPRASEEINIHQIQFKKKPILISEASAIVNNFIESPPKEQRQISIDDFDIVQKIGKGTYGDVFLAQEKRTRFLCVIKALSKKKIKDLKLEEHVFREIKIQSYLKHRHLTTLFGVFDDENKVYLILEFMPDGNMASNGKKKISESETAFLLQQVCEGLLYMHRQDIIHRDIKPENLLLNNHYIKIGDFGTSVFGNSLRKTVVGCLAYISPEQLTNTPYDDKIDAWSVGILCYELLFGKPPFEEKIKIIASKLSNDEPLQNIKKRIEEEKNFPNLAFPTDVTISDDAKSFIEKLLELDPSNRPDIRWALRHKFIQKSKEYQQILDSNL